MRLTTLRIAAAAAILLLGACAKKATTEPYRVERTGVAPAPAAEWAPSRPVASV